MNDHKSITDEILAMAARDQEMRKSRHWDEEVDREHTAKLKEIVKQYGWPTVSLVGEQASQMAWLLVQHADRDLDFQKHCLELMKQANEKVAGEVSPANIAYLTDRILVAEGKPQIYGTQFYTNEMGELVPRAIESEESVDKRRAEVGLATLAEYKKLMLENYS